MYLGHSPPVSKRNAREGGGSLLGLVPCSSLRRRLVGFIRELAGVPVQNVPGWKDLPSECPQKLSYRVALVSLVPSDSPPGLTHTNASASSSPVLPVGRTPKPAPLTLHQSPPRNSQSAGSVRTNGTFAVGLLTLSAEAGNGIAAGVDDGVVGHAVLLQERREGAVHCSWLANTAVQSFPPRLVAPLIAAFQAS